MAEPIRRMIRGGLAALGLQRVRHPAFTDVMRSRGVRTVLDVGANDGGFGGEIRDAGYRGRIVSFEPIAPIFAALSRRAARDPRWDVVNLGLGAVEGPQTIAVSESDVFSSFKQPSDYAANLWTGIAATREEVVQVARLDRLLADHPDYAQDAYLKIDTQGFEMEVLRGAGDRLRDFALVHAELALTPLYRDQHGWTEVVAWMEARGFRVVLVKENGVDWRTMRVVEVDVVFERIAAGAP